MSFELNVRWNVPHHKWSRQALKLLVTLHVGEGPAMWETTYQFRFPRWPWFRRDVISPEEKLRRQADAKMFEDAMREYQERHPDAL